MVVVPKGDALLGAASQDTHSRPDELPARTFRISMAFAVGKFEITRDQYDAFARATQRAAEGPCLTDRAQRGNWVMDAATNFREPGFRQAGNEPVECVSWDDAQAYVAWLNTLTTGGYHLLSEVEWEYVARAGSVVPTVYPWGDEPSVGCAHANGFDATAWMSYSRMDTSGYKEFDLLTCTDGYLHTAPVGSLDANAFDVHDMIGNTSEWIADCNLPTHAQLPADGQPAQPGSGCEQRLAKGGSWGTLGHNLRTAERFPHLPTHKDDSVGIRVAKTL
jgi:formylglycine-generating enzyme